MPRYLFGDYVLSTRRRILSRLGVERPLIPRYFDLLVYLIERRGEAVRRREIFDHVWSDVIVSESALSQAIRTIRRELDDDPRAPQFVRTVSRHGYEFVYVPVVVEDDVAEGGATPVEPAAGAAGDAPATADPPAVSVEVDRWNAPLATLLQASVDDDLRRDAAERLHALGTTETLARLGSGPGHVEARALLRDTRWAVAGAGEVPIVGQPSPVPVAVALARLRLRAAAGLVARRWAGAFVGGGAAGIVAGLGGGLLLTLAPGSEAPATVMPVLGAVGGVCGAVGAAGVGAGLSLAEALTRSRRALGLALGAAIGGGVVGLAVQVLVRWTVSALLGVRLHTGGGLEGLALGLAAGAGYGLAAPLSEGLAAPRGAARVRLVTATAVLCGLAGVGLAVAHRPLVGGTLHAIATASAGGQVVLTPLGRLLGEPDFGPLSAALISLGEGATFGAGLALGLTRRR